MSRYLRLFAALLALVWFAPAQADEVDQARQNVVRIIAVVDGPEGIQVWTGTGFAISPTRIVTNAHVVDDVYYADGPSGIGIVPGNTRKRIGARIVAFDPDKDLAVLEVEGAKFAPLKVFGGVFRDGSEVIALGYPGNVDELTDASVIEPQAAVRASGNFSNMSKSGGVEMMLHNAQIAHGNSGGPLVDQCGRVLGVNTLVTRNDRGDASFGFAISATELRAFLKRNGWTASVVDEACVPPELAEARRAAAAAKADREQTATDLKVRAEADAQRQQHLALLQDQRDNSMAIAALLLVMAALAGAYGLVAHARNDPDNPAPWKARIGWGGAALLALAAGGIFVSRPSLADSLPGATAPAIGASEVATDAADPAPGTAQAAPPVAARKLACAIDEGRSEYFETEPVPVNLTIDEQGCVNGRTQYAESGDGAWQRISAPKQDDAVARLSFDPKTMTYTQERWLADADTLTAARAAKDKLSSQACGMAPAERRKLADAQRSIVSTMSDAPDERLVYRCKPG